MIFSSVNESGEPAWRMVLDGRKTITRRRVPVDVGEVLGVRATRTGKELGKIRVVSCVLSAKWYMEQYRTHTSEEFEKILQAEAEREGFGSWEGLRKWFITHDMDIASTLRIEFEVVR